MKIIFRFLIITIFFLFNFLLTVSAQTTDNTGATSTAKAEPTGNSERGRELFTGNIRFSNGGAACNSCHNVDLKGFMSGGALGKDLTHAITRLSAPGVTMVVSGLPFPQMKETYGTKPVTKQEIADIVAFLTTADKEAPENVINKFGEYLLIGGIAGIVILLGLYSFFWIRRKKRPVNSIIFNRQVKST
ncbi:MAG: c-type cytochrome [Chitinophagaceae bacterium]|jgi:mono/diheme cytochrome c family protein|nr:c-type cytochrome [Chitinophagaceae bacterium]OQY95454.1 MAG: hypothetical protein B6D37_05535 [Sphingobacteriales bacterium UTBCD1]